MLRGMKSYEVTLQDEVYEGVVPEELFVKAMKSGGSIYLSEELKREIADTGAKEIARMIEDDLHRENSRLTPELLTYFYLFMDFESDFPRMLMMDGE